MHTDGDLSAYLVSKGLLLNEELETLKIELLNEAVTIGRDSSNQVTINFRTISHQHAKITCESDTWYIEDLSSKNGIFINDIKIKETPSVLTEGDVVSLGGVEFDFGLKRPQLLLRQDTITQFSTQAMDFDDKNLNDQTMHFSNVQIKQELDEQESSKPWYKSWKFYLVIGSLFISLAVAAYIFLYTDLIKL